MSGWTNDRERRLTQSHWQVTCNYVATLAFLAFVIYIIWGQ